MAIQNPNMPLGQMAQPLPQGAPQIQPAPQDPQGQAENTSKWQQILTSISQNPDAMRALGVAGAWISQGQPLGNAYLAAMNTHTNTLNAREEARRRFEQEGREEQRLGLEGRRVTVDESQAAEARRANQAREQQGREKLGLERSELEERKRASGVSERQRGEEIAAARANQQALVGIRQSMLGLARDENELKKFDLLFDTATKAVDPNQYLNDPLGYQRAVVDQVRELWRIMNPQAGPPAPPPVAPPGGPAPSAKVPPPAGQPAPTLKPDIGRLLTDEEVAAAAAKPETPPERQPGPEAKRIVKAAERAESIADSLHTNAIKTNLRAGDQAAINVAKRQIAEFEKLPQDAVSPADRRRINEAKIAVARAENLRKRKEEKEAEKRRRAEEAFK